METETTVIMQRFLLTVLFIVALLAPGAPASLAQPVASQAINTPQAFNGSTLIVENAGQWPEAARFQVWGSPLGAGTTWLTDDAIWISTEEPTPPLQGEGSDESPLLTPPSLGGKGAGGLGAGVNLKLTFPGSNPDVRIEPFDPLTTTVSYFLGNDPAKWRPDVPVYGGVRYVDLYPGVDLAIGEANGQWSWRLSRARLPGDGLDETKISVLRLEGAGVIGLEDGSLRLLSGLGYLGLSLPSTDLPLRVEAVGSKGEPAVFLAEAIDAQAGQPTAPARSAPDDDPADLLLGAFLGGSQWDEARGLAVDDAGRIALTGSTASGDFPTTPGAFDPSQNGNYDVFIARLNSAGTALDYATFLGGIDTDTGHALILDDDGAATIAGATRSWNFPATAGAFDTSYNGSDDAFVARIDASGAALDYATFLGGSSSDTGSSVALDANNRATVTGATCSNDFPATAGAFDTSPNGNWDAFVARLDATGSALDYATFLGGSSDDCVYGNCAVAVDSSQRATVTGVTQSSNFPKTRGAYDTSYNGGESDAFVVRFDATGSSLEYGTFLGGSGGDCMYGNCAVAVDPLGRAVVAGNTDSTDFPTTANAFDQTYNGGNSDAFVLKLNAPGSALEYSTFLGGASGDWGTAIALDTAGRVAVTGDTGSSDFPTTPGAFDLSFNGVYSDAFVAQLGADGSTLDYATFLGGGAYDRGYALKLDAASHAAVTGVTESSDFPTTFGALDPTYNGESDAFVVKLNLAQTFSACQADVNHDGIVDVYDLQALAGWWHQPGFPAALDVNHDGVIDIVDIMLVAGQWGGTC